MDSPPENSSFSTDDLRTFASTHWSVVLAAGHASSPDAQLAFENLCRAYWHPLYAFGRRQGRGPEEAKDLTQDFFLHLLEKNSLTGVDPCKGRFRSFLLASFKNLIANDWHRAHAAKRGGSTAIISLDAQAEEERRQLELPDALTPDRLFDRRWAETLLNRVLLRVRDEWNERDKLRRFDQLKVFLVERRGEVPAANAAERLGITESALRSMVHRLRDSYRRAFLAEIAKTVSSHEEIEDEVRYLLSVLGDG